MTTEFELSEKFQPFYKSSKSICVTSDGYIIADDGENINYINKATFQKIQNFNEIGEEVTCFAANPNDYTVIIANKNLILRKIDRFNKQIRHKTWNSNHSAPIFAMCLNSSSTRLTTGGADSKVRIWHLGQGEGNSYSCIYHKSKISIVKNHPVKNMVMSTSILDYEVVAWDTENGKRLGVFSGHQNLVTGIDFHAGTSQMITSSRDETLIVWNCESLEKMILVPTMEPMETCVVLNGFRGQADNDDYLVMVGGSSGIMKTVSVHRKKIIEEFVKESLFVTEAGMPDNKSKSGLKTIRTILNVDDSSIVIVRESDNIEFYSKEMKREYELAGDLSDIKDIVMIGPNRDVLLAVESAPYMRLFSCSTFFQDKDPNQGSVRTQWPCQLVCGGHTKDIASVSVFSDGLMVASGGKDGKVCIWQLLCEDRLRLKLVTSLENEGYFVKLVCVDGEGKRIYVHYYYKDSKNKKNNNMTIAVLSFDGSKLTRDSLLSKPHNDSISSMDINVTNTLLATGSKDKTAKIWCFNDQNKTIEMKGVLKGHRRGLWSVKFSKLEQVLLTSSMDQTIKLWSIEDFSCISTFQSEYVIYKALFYNNEKQIISCDNHGLVNVWNREKRCIAKSVDVHDESVDCLTLLTDSSQNVRGFAAAGGSAMICLYRDISEIHQTLIKEAQEAEIQQQQELDNLLFKEQYSRALRLAIKLKKPLSAYKILSKIQEMETQVVELMSANDMSKNTEIGRAVIDLKQEEMQQLFLFSIKWNTNTRTFLIGQRVIAIILCSVPLSELLLWPDFVKNIEALHAYSTRYYGRVKEESNHMALYNYFRDLVHIVPHIDLTMDTS